jgi:hypothetical protein
MFGLLSTLALPEKWLPDLFWFMLGLLPKF